MDQTGSQLENIFDVGFDAEILDASGEEWLQDPPPVVVFLLPGIRSDRGWAYAFTHRSFSPTAREIIPEIVTGQSDLGASDLAFRYRMRAFRNDYLEQIKCAIKKHTSNCGNLEVAFVCHSMGSAIFADIFPEIKKYASSGGFEISNIVFLGSVAKRTVSNTLGGGHNFINDVGQKDFWPVAAWILTPWKYDPVGRFGFGRAMVVDRIFDNDHSSCTEIKHLEDWVIPIIEDGIVKKNVISTRKTWYNFYRAVHKIIWLGVPISIVAAHLFF
jgi:hypothetical protein